MSSKSTNRVHVTFETEITELFRAIAAREKKPVASIVRKMALRQLLLETTNIDLVKAS